MNRRGLTHDMEFPIPDGSSEAGEKTGSITSVPKSEMSKSTSSVRIVVPVVVMVVENVSELFSRDIVAFLEIGERGFEKLLFRSREPSLLASRAQV